MQKDTIQSKLISIFNHLSRWIMRHAAPPPHHHLFIQFQRWSSSDAETNSDKTRLEIKKFNEIKWEYRSLDNASHRSASSSSSSSSGRERERERLWRQRQHKVDIRRNFSKSQLATEFTISTDNTVDFWEISTRVFFCRARLQKRPIIWRSLLIVATP